MRHLLLFGKLPRLGGVKTRLVPPLTPVEAVRLYKAFLDDQLRFLCSFESWARIAWWVDEYPHPADFPSAPGIEVRLQCQGNLGTRLVHAFEAARRGRPGPVVVIGADSPTLPGRHVRAAFAALEAGTTAVIAPADDGGYVLVGMNRTRRELFEGVRWGGAEVAATTRRRALEAAVDLVEIEPWYDVDEVRSLHRLREEIERAPGAQRAPATARCLVDLELPPVV